MLHAPGPLARRNLRATGLRGLSSLSRKDWFSAPAFADMAAIADFNADRYAITTVPLAGIPAATAAELCVKRACAFAEWFAFTCASTTARMYQDAGGVVRSDLAVDQPRFDWSNGKRQLALNGQATNLLLRSSEFSLSPWTAGPGGNTLVVTTGQTGPDGLPTACRIDETSAGTADYARQTVTIPNDSASYAPSFFYKAETSTKCSARFALTNGTAIAVQAVFDSVAKSFSGVTGGTWTFRELPLGWFRLTCVFANNATGNTTFDYRVYPTDLSSVANVGSGLFWGAQIETGTYATAHIPTAAAAVTRAIESARLSPTIEAILQRSAASIVVRGQNMLRAGGRIAGTTGPYSLLRSNSALTPAIFESSAGALVSAAGTAVNLSAWGMACGFDGAGRSLVRNGVSNVTDALSAPSRSEVYLARDGSNSAFGDGRYDFVGIAPSRLPDARLTAIAVPVV